MKKVYYILCLLFVFVTFFVNRGSLPTDIMESRNIVTAREMVSDGNWLVPTMNGKLRLEKPPLPTWVAGAIESVAPDNLSAQRIAPGVMGCIWTLFLFLTVRYISKRDDLALVTILVFLTCYNLVLMGRSATWDIYCHAFMMGGVYFLMRGLYEDKRSWVWFPSAGLMMGLSFLSKGPVSFYTILLPFLVLVLLFPRPSMRGKWGAFAAMVAITIAVGCWWYIYLFIAHPEAMSAVAAKESGSWSNHNVRPWYYYWSFFLEMGAWAILMLFALDVPYWKKHITLKREYLIAITWCLVTLILLSLMPEKKNRYLLPLLASSSMAVACLIIHFCEGPEIDGFSRKLFLFNSIILSIIIIAIPVLGYQYGVRRGYISMTQETVTAAVCFLVALWITLNTLQWHPIRVVGGIVFLFAFTECYLLSSVGKIFGNPDAYDISHIRSNKEAMALPFYHPEKEPMRIEPVYKAHKKILPINTENTDSMLKALPCVLISRGYVAKTIPANILAHIDTTTVGVYDNNAHRKTDRHYTLDLVHHATILRMK